MPPEPADSRLPAGIEVASLIRRAEASGDVATVLRKGDPDRGALILLVSSRGRHVAVLERVLDLTGAYIWRLTGPSESAGSTEIMDFLAKRARFDEDFWAIELDVAEPQRFIAETGATG